TVTTLGLLDWKVKVSVTLAPVESCAAAVSGTNLPTSRLTFGDGDSETDAGTGKVVTVVEVGLLHEKRNAQPTSAHTSHVAEINLRMNPSAKRLVASGKLSV
ncbi:MAG TPA: hypothetical protein VFM77_11965, partial [Terriglobales bacterium]|nr:hypothetical protein [Terriglobales bacterium]